MNKITFLTPLNDLSRSACADARVACCCCCC